MNVLPPVYPHFLDQILAGRKDRQMSLSQKRRPLAGPRSSRLSFGKSPHDLEGVISHHSSKTVATLLDEAC